MHTVMQIFCVSNDLDGNYSPTRANGVGLSGPDIQWQTFECGPSDFYLVLNFFCDPEGSSGWILVGFTLLVQQ
jgi:hypothetical protein